MSFFRCCFVIAGFILVLAFLGETGDKRMKKEIPDPSSWLRGGRGVKVSKTLFVWNCPILQRYQSIWHMRRLWVSSHTIKSEFEFTFCLPTIWEETYWKGLVIESCFYSVVLLFRIFFVSKTIIFESVIIILWNSSYYRWIVLCQIAHYNIQNRRNAYDIGTGCTDND